MGGDEFSQQLNRVLADVATLVLQTTARKICSILPALGELGGKAIRKVLAIFKASRSGPGLDILKKFAVVNLDRFGPAVWVDIREPLFEQVEKGTHLRIVVFASLIVLHQFGDQVSTDLDDGVSQVVGLSTT